MPQHARQIEHEGRTQTIESWAEATGIPVETIRCRLDRLGWNPARALTERPDRRFRKGGRPRVAEARPVPRLRPLEGRAVARWRAFGREYSRSFGPWGTAEARAAYQRFAAEWAAGSVYTAGGDETRAAGLHVADLVERWLLWVAAEYRKGGKITSEVHGSRAAAIKLVELYGDTLAADFRPAQLRAVRAAWIAEGLARKTVNAYAWRVARCFGWGVGQSLIEPATHQALLQVEKLRPGRTTARESVAVKPVDAERVAAALAKLPDDPRGRAIRAMVEVQRITGMRPQHLCEMRPCDIDRAAEVWAYLPPPAGTKTFHLGKRPRFYLGARAQAILAPLLEGCPADRRLFGRQYAGSWVAVTVDAYGKAIRHVCRRAGVAPWHPHQLRHTAATRAALATESLADAAALIGDNERMAGAVYVHADPADRRRRELAERFG